ncbi:MAG: type II toxin-antitoxin system HicB family antitoxin [bacterium]
MAKKNGKIKKTFFKLPLVLDPQPEGGYTVTCPIVPELITEGDTVSDALNNANDALSAVIEAFQDLNKPLPHALKQAMTDAPMWLETLVTVE